MAFPDMDSLSVVEGSAPANRFLWPNVVKASPTQIILFHKVIHTPPGFGPATGLGQAIDSGKSGSNDRFP